MVTAVMTSVLVVDDVPANLVGMSRALDFLGLEPVQATNGREALDVLRSRGADLVLLDITMPVMDGFATLTTIRADPDLRHVPVYMISGTDDPSEVARCWELGATGFLSKPFTMAELEATLLAVGLLG